MFKLEYFCFFIISNFCDGINIDRLVFLWLIWRAFGLIGGRVVRELLLEVIMKVVDRCSVKVIRYKEVYFLFLVFFSFYCILI